MSIHAVLFNARSIVNKWLHILADLQSLHVMPELIFITESWLTADNTFIFQGLPYYSVHRCDRNDRGDGVVLLAHPSLRVVVPNIVIPACGMEVLFADVLLTSSIPIRLITVYRPPSSTAVNSLALCKFLQSDVVSRNKLLVILGDFNLPDINWTSWSSDAQNYVTNCAFLDAFAALHLCQLISFPTRHNATLDLILAPKLPSPVVISNVTDAGPMANSDHSAIVFDVTTPLPISSRTHAAPPPKYCFARCNFAEAETRLCAID